MNRFSLILAAFVMGVTLLAGSEPGRQDASPGLNKSGLEHTYTPETLKLFSQRVQPILVNSCGTGSCHGGATKLGFELARPTSNGQIPALLTRQNLVQTLRLVDAEDPDNSLLLRKAVEPHGQATRPPLPGRDAPAYRILQDWVRQHCEKKLRPDAEPPAEPPTTVKTTSRERPALPQVLEEKFASLSTTSEKTELPIKEAPEEPAGQATSPSSSSEATKQAAPAPSNMPPATKGPRNPPAAPVDAFDPVQFNQRYHPDKP